MSETIYMPTKDGRTQPAPFVMTDEEVGAFCRLDCGNLEASLKRYREKGWLKPVRVGKFMRYFLKDVVKFLETSQKENPR